MGWVGSERGPNPVRARLPDGAAPLSYLLIIGGTVPAIDPYSRPERVMPPEVVDMILGGLEDLAAVNRHEFSKSPALVEEYERAVGADSNGALVYPPRFVYVPDWEATECRELNCWSPFRSIAERYRGKASIPVDCKDCSTMVAGYLAYRQTPEVYVGLVIGSRVSHAVAGVRTPKGRLKLIDPSRWYGMPETTYDGVRWRRVRDT